jgi:hypothetical protein
MEAVPGTCEMCGQALVGTEQRRFCSRTCANRRQQPTIHMCEECSSPFSVRPNKVAAGKGHFCSRACYLASVKRPEKRCAYCGELIPETGWHHAAKYCSQRCYRTDQPNPAWKGGRITDKHGYVLVWVPGHPMTRGHGYIAEHRLVMAETLGRNLGPQEVVHHINGNRDDNRVENLQVFASQAQHIRHHGSKPEPSRS